MDKNNLRQSKIITVFLISILVLATLLVLGHYFIQTHFLWGTKIEGVSCTFLSVEDAIEKINLEKKKQKVTLHFNNDKAYEVLLETLGVYVDETQVVQIFEKQHLEPKESREYELDGYILLDKQMLRNFLKQIPELQKENMFKAQNAYIVWDEKEFSIEKEKLGNVIHFEHAISLVYETIKYDQNQIDFAPITEEMPEILCGDLESEKDQLNSVLKSIINFELSDGSIVTLDSSTIKNWVSLNENNKFVIDVENGIIEFVDYLAIKVNEANSNMYFIPTNSESFASVNVPKAVRAQLDKQNQIVEIRKHIGNSEPICLDPIYDRKIISDTLVSYIEIDISRQHIWFYKDGELIVDTPCVTGNVSEENGTPTGVFFLKRKTRQVYLKGFNNDGSKYSSFVEYWMPFNKGIGMHDASWRAKFGGNIYLTNGSHGCINMPFNAAKKTYENINNNIPIIVYQS